MKLGIEKVMSYKNSWKNFEENHQTEWRDILTTLEYLVDYNQRMSELNSNNKSYRKTETHWNLEIYQLWEEILSIFKWKELPGDTPLQRRLGPIKNNISVSIDLLDREIDIIRRIFITCKDASNTQDLFLPVFLTFTKKQFEAKESFIYNTHEAYSKKSFEDYESEIKLISPLVYEHPFLILGLSEFCTDSEVKIIKLESAIKNNTQTNTIERHIEFPSEHFHTCLGLLNYFGEYIKSEYPDQKPKIKIEQQEDYSVKLVIESPDGRKDIIERALYEYTQIISGNELPEKYMKNNKAIALLKNKLHIAHLEIKSLNEIIETKDIMYEKVLHLAFSKTTTAGNNIIINNHQANSNTAQVTIHQVAEDIKNLSKELPEPSEAKKELERIEEAVNQAENGSEDSKKIALSKLQSFINEAIKEDSKYHKALKTAKQGWEILGKVADRYNKVAGIFGLPVVPEQLYK